MTRTPSTPLRAAVYGVKLAIVSAVAAIAVVPTLGTTPSVPSADETDPNPTTADVTAQARLDDLMERHDCSATGFGPDVIPGSALVERDDRVERVSFDDGWAIYTGEASGSLLAVCRSAL